MYAPSGDQDPMESLVVPGIRTTSSPRRSVTIQSLVGRQQHVPAVRRRLATQPLCRSRPGCRRGRRARRGKRQRSDRIGADVPDCIAGRLDLFSPIVETEGGEREATVRRPGHQRRFGCRLREIRTVCIGDHERICRSAHETRPVGRHPITSPSATTRVSPVVTEMATTWAVVLNLFSGLRVTSTSSGAIRNTAGNSGWLRIANAPITSAASGREG